MARFIRHARWVHESRFILEFQSKKVLGASLAFESDERGIILNPRSINDLAIENLIKGLYSGEYSPPTVEREDWDRRESAIIGCPCGVGVVLEDPMTNGCPRCGRLYNGCGQELCHPRFWGEETGESFSDDGSYIVGSGEEL